MTTVNQGVLHQQLALQTPAKINLTLEVLGRREDGYHDIRSIVIGVDLRDDVRVRTVGRTNNIVVHCDDPNIEASDNLAGMAAKALMDRCSGSCGADIRLRKRIPVGAGMGGGSSDAAATLRLCNELWGLDLNDDALATIGADIGSDVPLFFSLPGAIVSGRGECVGSLSMRWQGWVLLIMPLVSTSTRDVYAAWQSGDGRGDRPTPGDVGSCATAAELSFLLLNDLAPAVFRVAPALKDLQHTIALNTDRPVHVTGSGSTLFQLFDDYDRAAAMAKTVKSLCPEVRVTVVAAPVGWGDFAE